MSKLLVNTEGATAGANVLRSLAHDEETESGRERLRELADMLTPQSEGGEALEIDNDGYFIDAIGVKTRALVSTALEENGRLRAENERLRRALRGEDNTEQRERTALGTPHRTLPEEKLAMTCLRCPASVPSFGLLCADCAAASEGD